MFNGAGVFIGHFSPFVVFAALGTETGSVSTGEGREGGREGGREEKRLRTLAGVPTTNQGGREGGE